MVVVAEKVGTLCIEYRPSETTATLVGEDGVFDSRECNQFIIETRFLPGYVPFLPIYALDPRCYSQMRIKCYSIFDAIDFIDHLELDRYELKFIPCEIYDPGHAGDEFYVGEVEFEGELAEQWSMRVRVMQTGEHLLLTNRNDVRSHLTDLTSVFKKHDRSFAHG